MCNIQGQVFLARILPDDFYFCGFVCLLVFFVVDLLGIFCFVLVLLVFFFLPSLGAHCNSGHSSFLKVT